MVTDLAVAVIDRNDPLAPLEEESPEAFQAFLDWHHRVENNLPRTFTALAGDYKLAARSELAVPTESARQLGVWSTKYEWKKRLRAFYRVKYEERRRKSEAMRNKMLDKAMTALTETLALVDYNEQAANVPLNKLIESIAKLSSESRRENQMPEDLKEEKKKEESEKDEEVHSKVPVVAMQEDLWQEI